MAKRRVVRWSSWQLRRLATCAWACALLLPLLTDVHADVDTSTGHGDNTLTNSVGGVMALNFINYAAIIRKFQYILMMSDGGEWRCREL
ncbi:unnamed protein product [Pieris macdunnoughi]|uniref:Uncharacterized protein n=1 Tax=Pieris macdunnoughi TaxID=345717 RepID=A0A821NUJ4_9NEOP|nr:unnamed protein product [Pieris macdunnoughi]